MPDQSHTFLTAGYGTFNYFGHVGDNDYATGLANAGWYARSGLHSGFPYFDDCNEQFCGAGYGAVVRSNRSRTRSPTFQARRFLIAASTISLRRNSAGDPDSGFAPAGSIGFANAHPNSYGYIHAYPNGNSYGDSHCDLHAQANAHCEARPDTEATSDPTSSPDPVKIIVASI